MLTLFMRASFVNRERTSLQAQPPNTRPKRVYTPILARFQPCPLSSYSARASGAPNARVRRQGPPLRDLIRAWLSARP